MADAAEEEYFELIEVHDRTFQHYSVINNVYLAPVDEDEEERLVLEARILLEVFQNRLFLVPLEYPRQVLECGYGRGAWATQMALVYECQVTAIDIYPAELSEEPENLVREIWNLNDRLLPTYRAGQYDLVHSRCVGLGIKKSRWRTYVRDLGQLTRRGGYVQLAEFYYNIQSDNGRLTENHAIYKWGVAFRTALDVDKDPRAYRNFERYLRDAGLTNVQTMSVHIPIGDWSTDPRQQAIGLLNRESMEELVESHAIYPFTQQLGWTVDQVSELTDQIRDELNDNSLHLYLPLYIAWGYRR
ncbi:S-adenosyl-L-methionine-dependent methyltransferase [Microthyrium microscopicum]|uniref:S-adenosyl-L-methionine-dependent methyltransferase n=1 Tax=Microthyrium microscopicum TaxID=703497 RepID=A0A6A6U256_9PEZI|nr:S-adenosyl-L-methionine-dependent methyltransferase [Microthyrium microscopicum]